MSIKVKKDTEDKLSVSFSVIILDRRSWAAMAWVLSPAIIMQPEEVIA